MATVRGIFGSEATGFSNSQLLWIGINTVSICPALLENYTSPFSAKPDRARQSARPYKRPAVLVLVCYPFYTTHHGQLAKEHWSHPYAKNLEKKGTADPRESRAGLHSHPTHTSAKLYVHQYFNECACVTFHDLRNTQ